MSITINFSQYSIAQGGALGTYNQHNLSAIYSGDYIFEDISDPDTGGLTAWGQQIEVISESNSNWTKVRLRRIDNNNFNLIDFDAIAERPGIYKIISSTGNVYTVYDDSTSDSRKYPNIDTNELSQNFRNIAYVDFYAKAYTKSGITITKFHLDNIELSVTIYTTNICFPAGSIVNTDQGKIAIEKLVPYVNTIDNKKIVTVTETYMSDDTIVKIKKNALGKNVPNKDTVISLLHKVFNQGKLIEAYKLANFYKDIKYIPYKGEKLYNVLMENWEMMKVNNLTVETLHPENVIAKLHNSKLPEDKKLQLLGEISQAVINEDHQKFDFIKNYVLKN